MASFMSEFYPVHYPTQHPLTLLMSLPCRAACTRLFTTMRLVEISFIALLASLTVMAATASSSDTMGATSSTSSEREVDLECYDEDEVQHITQLMESTCDYNIFMCCWTENDGEGMEDNTDVCRYTDSSQTTRDYPGDSEGEVHCHGFGWPKKSNYHAYIEPLYHYVRNFDHRDYRGYYGS